MWGIAATKDRLDATMCFDHGRLVAERLLVGSLRIDYRAQYRLALGEDGCERAGARKVSSLIGIGFEIEKLRLMTHMVRVPEAAISNHEQAGCRSRRNPRTVAVRLAGACPDRTRFRSLVHRLSAG